MANSGRRDVDITVRAKDAASKAAKSITDALGDLAKALKTTGDGAGKTGSLLTQFGASLAELTKAVSGNSSISKLSENFDRAAAAVARLEKTTEEARQSQQKLASDIDKTGAVLAKQQSQAEKLAARLADQKAKTDAMKSSLSEYNAALRAATTEQGRADRAYQAAGAAYEAQFAKLNAIAKAQNKAADAVDAADEPTRAQIATYERLTAAYDKANAKLKDLGKAYIDAGDRLDKANVALDRAQAAQTRGSEAYAKAQAAQAKTAAALKEVQDQVKTTSVSLSRMQDEFSSVGRSIEQSTAALASAREELAEVSKAAEAGNASLSKIGQTVRQQLLRALADGKTALQAFQAQWQAATIETANTAKAGLDTSASIANGRAAKEAYTQLQAALHTLRQEANAAGTDVGKLSELFNGDSESALRFRAALDQVNASIERSSKAAVSGGPTPIVTPEVVNNAARARSAIRGVGTAAKDAEEETGAFSRTMELLNGSSRQTLSLTQRLRGEILSLTASFVGVYGAIAAARQAIETYNDRQSVATRLAVAFGGNQQKVASEMAWLRDQADRLGISYNDLSKQYADFSVAVEQSPGLAGKERQLFLPFVEAGRVLNMTADDVNGVFLAITQMVNKGVISMQDLRQQLGDRLVGSFELLANAMGLTGQQLAKFIATGNLATDIALPALARQIEAVFGPQVLTASKSLTAEIARFSNSLGDAQEEFVRGGFADSLASSLRQLTDFFKSDDGQKFFAELGAAAGHLVEIIAAIPRYFDEIKDVLTLLIGLKVSKFIRTFYADLAAAAPVKAFIEAINNLRVTQAEADEATQVLSEACAANLKQMRAAPMVFAQTAAAAEAMEGGFLVATAATGALTTAFSLLRAVGAALMTTLPGLVLTGIVFVLGQWLTKTDEATDALNKHEKALDRIRKAYQSAQGDVKDWADEIKNTSAAELNLSTVKLQQSLRDLQRSTLPWGVINIFGSYSPGTVPKINALLDQFRSGSLAAKDFREQVAKLALEDKKFTDSSLVDDLIAIADKAEGLEKGISENNAALRLLSNQGSDADKKLLGLGDSVSTVAVKAKDSATALASFLKQIEAINPDTRVESEADKKIEQLELLQKLINSPDSGIEKGSDAWNKLADAIGRAKDAINKDVDTKRISDLAGRIIGAESGGDVNAKNPNSTATGLGQFIESTWLTLFRKYYPEQAATLGTAGILELRKDQKFSEDLVEKYAAENNEYLQKNSQFYQQATGAVKEAALYLAHFLGPAGAKSLLNAPSGTPVSSLLSQQQIQANQSVLAGKTNDQVLAWAQKRISLSQSQVDLEERIAKAQQTQVDAQSKYDQSLDGQIDQLQIKAGLKKSENDFDQASSREAYAQLVVQKAINEAEKKGVTISDEKKQALHDAAVAYYDQAHAADQLAAMEKELGALMTHRQALQTELSVAKANGDTGAQEQIKQQIADTNAQLDAGVARWIAYWKSVGGPDADTALAKLYQYIAKNPFTMTVEQINSSLAQGLGGTVIDNFLDNLKQGENAIRALGDAFRSFAADFLKRMAEMILQQIIFNALQKSGFGSWFGGATGIAASVAHTGGVIGAGGLGSRNVAAAWYANAVRYHSGGIAGLKPDEVPAILQKGEEVLTDDDPRHRNNLAAGGAPNVKIVNAVDAGSFVSAGLNTGVGQKAFFNFIQANQATVKRSLGINR